jgi:hypothetical protein
MDRFQILKQTVIGKLFIALPPAPHLPVPDPNDLGRLPPRDPLGQRSQNYFLYFHRPLHCCKRTCFAGSPRRLEKMEERSAKSLDDLTKALDKFLKRLADIEEEWWLDSKEA